MTTNAEWKSMAANPPIASMKSYYQAMAAMTAPAAAASPAPSFPVSYGSSVSSAQPIFGVTTATVDKIYSPTGEVIGTVKTAGGAGIPEEQTDISVMASEPEPSQATFEPTISHTEGEFAAIQQSGKTPSSSGSTEPTISETKSYVSEMTNRIENTKSQIESLSDKAGPQIEKRIASAQQRLAELEYARDSAESYLVSKSGGSLAAGSIFGTPTTSSNVAFTTGGMLPSKLSMFSPTGIVPYPTTKEVGTAVGKEYVSITPPGTSISGFVPSEMTISGFGRQFDIIPTGKYAAEKIMPDASGILSVGYEVGAGGVSTKMPENVLKGFDLSKPTIALPEILMGATKRLPETRGATTTMSTMFAMPSSPESKVSFTSYDITGTKPPETKADAPMFAGMGTIQDIMPAAPMTEYDIMGAKVLGTAGPAEKAGLYARTLFSPEGYALIGSAPFGTSESVVSGRIAKDLLGWDIAKKAGETNPFMVGFKTGINEVWESPPMEAAMLFPMAKGFAWAEKALAGSKIGTAALKKGGISMGAIFGGMRAAEVTGEFAAGNKERAVGLGLMTGFDFGALIAAPRATRLINELPYIGKQKVSYFKQTGLFEMTERPTGGFEEIPVFKEVGPFWKHKLGKAPSFKATEFVGIKTGEYQQDIIGGFMEERPATGISRTAETIEMKQFQTIKPTGKEPSIFLIKTEKGVSITRPLSAVEGDIFNVETKNVIRKSWELPKTKPPTEKVVRMQEAIRLTDQGMIIKKFGGEPGIGWKELEIGGGISRKMERVFVPAAKKVKQSKAKIYDIFKPAKEFEGTDLVLTKPEPKLNIGRDLFKEMKEPKTSRGSLTKLMKNTEMRISQQKPKKTYLKIKPYYEEYNYMSPMAAGIVGIQPMEKLGETIGLSSKIVSKPILSISPKSESKYKTSLQPTLKILQQSSQKERMMPSLKSLSLLALPKSEVSQKNILEIGSSYSQKSMFKTTTKQSQKFIEEPIVPTTKTPFFPELPVMFGGFSRVKRPYRKPKQPKSYTPSLVGILSGKTVRKAPGRLTGGEIRYPIMPMLGGGKKMRWMEW